METPQEIIARINKEKPLTIGGRRPFLYRSKLIEYRNKFGRDYEVPKGFDIIEDIAK